MTGINWLCLLVHVLGLPHLSFQQIMRDEIHFYYNNTYKFNTPYVLEVNKSTEYILEFAGDSESYTTPARVSVASDFANRTYPLFITARQQKGVFSWQLPMLVQTPLGVQQFTNVSRTLCPRNNLWAADEDTCDVTTPNTPIVHLTSSSPESVRVTITVETVPDFYIQLNTTTNLTTTPSQPKYYFFPFDQNHHLDLESQHERRLYRCQDYGGNWGGVNLAGMKSDGVNVNGLKSDGVNVNGVKSDGVNVNGVKSDGDSWRGFMEGTNLEVHSWLSRPKSVIVMIESDDDICAVVSIQNVSCPVFDNERDILYDGYYLTMTRRGGITLTQDTFPLGFYIVFIVKTSDEDCNDNSVTNGTLPRGHYVGWGEGGAQVWSSDGRVKNFSFRIIQTISYQEYVIAASVPLAFFGSFYVAFLLAILCQRKYHRPDGTEHQAQEEEGRLTPPSVPHDEVNVVTTRRRHVNVMSDSGGSSSRQAEGDTIPIVAGGSSSSDTDSDFSTLEDIQAEKDLYMLGTRLCVANLARCRPRVLSARSKMYLWNVLTVAVFYTLPVIQLVVTYQRLLNQSGNQDLCYYNFLCAHPLVVLSDFNHVYSNLGYVMLGALFLALVRRRRAKHDARPALQKQLGIPQHFGLLYAMGVALVSEGLLSAAYHVCPNSMNFQFDTSFMYVTAVLCMVKLYQSRHADINARAHATFGVLALVIFIGLVGVLNANFYFWVAFTVLHLVTCLIMTFQIYYLGRFRLDAAVLVRAARELVAAPLAAVTPTHCGRCVLLLIANATNWALAAYGVAQQSRDFASHLLLVLMTNLFLYTLFYIVMKLLHREAIRWYSWVFIGLTYSIWFGSSYFYLDQSTNWALTPAQSRQNNRQCSLLQLYDSHDIWHFLSASAMFFSFNMYLTIDDNLAHTPRSEIMVF